MNLVSAKSNEKSYEIGFQDGANDVIADWSFALDEAEIELEPYCGPVVAEISSLRERNKALEGVAEAARSWREEDRAYGEAVEFRDWQTCDTLAPEKRLAELRSALSALEGKTE
jgi:hypothetical protein